MEKKDGMLSVSINNPIKFSVKDTKNNQKMLLVLLRLFKKENGKELVTFKKISALFGLKSRQDSNNFYREFQQHDGDFKDYLERKKDFRDALPLIEKQILQNPLLKINEHYKDFIETHPKFKMSYTCFRDYFSQIDALKLKNKYDQLTTEDKIKPDTERFLKEILEDETTGKSSRKKILKTFPKLEQKEKDIKVERRFQEDMNTFGIYLLVMILTAFGLNYQILSIMLGVSKSTIHNKFHTLSFVGRAILSSINSWSGEIATDEKWVKINGKWHYVISIVDNKTGFPLYFQLVSDLKKPTWELFFNRFYKLYGKPRLIISDGSSAIAGAIKSVFPGVNHQLCKFHKLKNLMKKIYSCRCSYKKQQQMIALAKGIFDNMTYFGRKRAAQKLMEISPEEVSKYVEKSILGKWNQLTKRLTSNSAERWNRKIEKVILGRYGLKSEQYVIQLMNSLWLKEAVLDKRHFAECFLDNIKLGQLCQDNLKMCNVVDSIKHKLLEKVA
ncbi:MAG: DDE-type integrase/transposase/recombinase [Candidatus Cloacimonadota bacterium]|nr:DDE-type integrase/transposase/recombinase [Candidatus Cloacimonadota bacterium]